MKRYGAASVAVVFVALALASTAQASTAQEDQRNRPVTATVTQVGTQQNAPSVMKPVMSAEAIRSMSKESRDMSGWMPSLYRGIWWDSKWKNIRICIMKRESNFSYRAANKSSSARGAYQFLDNSWRDGLVWMFIAESKKTGDGLASEARKLRKIPIHKWSRYWQDRAFYTALRNGKGLHHWTHQVPGTGCF